MHLEPERRQAMGAAARESARRYAWPEVAERVEGVYERAVASFRSAESRNSHTYRGNSTSRRRPRAPRPFSARARRLGLVPIDGSPRLPARRIPPLASEPPRARASLARRVGLAAAAGRRRRADLPRRHPHRDRRGRRRGPALGSQLGPRRNGADGRVDAPARRVVARDRAGSAATGTASPSRRHLGDDGRRPHVGDAAGAFGRAGPRHGPGPAHRPGARHVPGPPGNAGLPDHPQPRRACLARRDHRRLDRSVLRRNRAALPCECRASPPCCCRSGRADPPAATWLWSPRPCGAGDTRSSREGAERASPSFATRDTAASRL